MSALHANYALAKEMPSRSGRTLSASALDRILLCGSAGIGLAQAWISRYSMDADGISYLDMGNSFSQGDWRHAVNAYWSPLYGWLLGLTVRAIRPGPRWEFPVVHAVNFGIFLLALAAFQFLLRSLVALAGYREIECATNLKRGSTMPEWAFVLLGYATFLWACLRVVTIYDVSPDMAVLACVCLSAGILVRLRISPSPMRFGLFGFVLGVAYWVKAPMFPLGIAFLVLAILWKAKSKQWRRGMGIACAVFLCGTAPLIALLSLQKGRLTFGDSARLNYCWFVSPGTTFRNWHGQIAGSGSPVHPMAELLKSPPVYGFDGPVAGTYPLWADPSYWNEGLRWRFQPIAQVKTLTGNLLSEARLVLQGEPALLAGLVVLIWLAGTTWFSEARRLWPLLAICGAGFALYLPVHVEDRFLGGWMLLFVVTVLATVRLNFAEQRAGKIVAAVICGLILVGAADQTIRYATHHLAIPGVGPNSALDDVAAAEQMPTVGLNPGDKVALIGIGKGVYAAHLARLRVVAEAMGYDHGYRDFTRLPQDDRRKLYSALRTSGAKAILTPCSEGIDKSWRRTGGAEYCVLRLDQD